MEARDMMITVVTVGLVAIVGFLIFSSVSNSSDSLYIPQTNVKVNESVTISSVADGATNSTLLTESGYVQDQETVRNSSNSALLIRNVDYRVTSTATSGALDNRANFTLLNISVDADRGFNNTALKITYNHNVKSASQTTKDKLETSVLSAFELGVVALIVIAAVVIIGGVYMLGK